jgi:glycosyltransferase involved in cell wall biosynthesis
MYENSDCDRFANLLTLRQEDLTHTERINLDAHLRTCTDCLGIQADHHNLISQLRSLPLQLSTMKPVPHTERYPMVSVVIPVYNNETLGLEYLLESIPPTIGEVILLINGRVTEDIAFAAEQLFPNVRIVKQTGKRKDEALKAGFAHCTGEIITMLAADGTTNPNEIPRFIEALLAGNAFAKGSRFIKGGRSNDRSIIGRLGSYGLSRLVKFLFRTEISDLCYGYNAFWREFLDYVEINPDDLFGDSNVKFKTSLSLRLLNATMKVTEVPSVERPSADKQNDQLSFHDAWQMLKALVKARVAGKLQDAHRNVYMEIRPSLNGSLQ